MAHLPTLRKIDASHELSSGRRRASLILTFSALLLAVAAAWAYFAHLDQISRASGQIIPAGHIQVVQAPDGGQILRIQVREGDQVRRGQVLFVLDEVKARAAVDEGRVSYISPDTLAEQAPGMQEHTYYRVHVRVDTKSMKKFEGKAIRLQPGMTATVEIKTGNNTVLSYLLKPVIKTLSESLGER